MQEANDFGNDFNPLERGLFESPNISLMLKSWLTFYRFGKLFPSY